jgi:putative thioredoxin
MTPTTPVFDADTASFEADVLERSHEVPVVVDFWAAWCGPCRTLGPMLEEAVTARGGEVALAKVDVDANQQLAAAFRVQGIPAVKAFRDGKVVAEFTGAIPRNAIEQFLDGIVPTAADREVAAARALVASDPAAARAHATAALELDPRHPAAALLLAELVLAEEPERALELVKPHRPAPEFEAVATRAELALTGGDAAALAAAVAGDPFDGVARLQLGRLRAADGDYAAAIDLLLQAVRLGGDTREPAREQLVAIFGVLGDDNELVRTARPRLAAALY